MDVDQFAWLHGCPRSPAPRSWSPASRCWSTAGSTRGGSGPRPRTGAATRSGTWSTSRSTATWPRSVVTCTTSSSTAPCPQDAAGPALHLVAGGGGAFVHATHTYANADHDSRVRNNPASPFYALPERSFPSRDESFSHFARCSCPSVVRAMGHLLLFLAGGLAGSLGSLLDLLPGWSTPWRPAAGPPRPAPAGGGTVARRRDTRTSPFARRVVSAGSFAVGLLAASGGVPARPGPFPALPGGVAGVHRLPLRGRSPGPPFRLVAAGRRVQPEPPLAALRPRRAGALWAGVPAASRSRPGPGAPEAVAGALLIFVVAWVGFWARRRRFTAAGVGELARRRSGCSAAATGAGTSPARCSWSPCRPW